MKKVKKRLIKSKRKVLPKKRRKKEEKVKKILRISSGIENLNPLIGGGFPKNSINLLIGSSGCGKTIFATQFIVEGIKNNENCLYVTFEEKKDSFYKNMAQLGWDLEKYEKEGKFTFLEYTPSKINNMLEEGGGSIEEIIIDRKVQRLVIDSITSFALLFKNELDKREAALKLFNIISKWSCTTLMTVEEDSSQGNLEETSRSLEFEADSVILLYFERRKEIRKRYLEILKMRGTDHSKRMYIYQITNKGIQIDKKPTNEKIKAY